MSPLHCSPFSLLEKKLYPRTCSARISLLNSFCASVLALPLFTRVLQEAAIIRSPVIRGQLWNKEAKPQPYQDGHLHTDTQCRARHGKSVVGKDRPQGDNRQCWWLVICPSLVFFWAQLPLSRFSKQAVFIGIYTHSIFKVNFFINGSL